VSGINSALCAAFGGHGCVVRGCIYVTAYRWQDLKEFDCIILVHSSGFILLDCIYMIQFRVVCFSLTGVNSLRVRSVSQL
jgi:hypothetical protein